MTTKNGARVMVQEKVKAVTRKVRKAVSLSTQKKNLRKSETR